MFSRNNFESNQILSIVDLYIPKYVYIKKIIDKKSEVYIDRATS